jgi:hypothetical protein
VAPQNLVRTNGESKIGEDGMRRPPATHVRFALSSHHAKIFERRTHPAAGIPPDEILRSDSWFLGSATR